MLKLKKKNNSGAKRLNCVTSLCLLVSPHKGRTVRLWLRVRSGRIWSLPSLLENRVGALSLGLELQESKADHSFLTYGHRCTSHGSSTSASALNRYNSSPAYFHIFTSSRIALCMCDAVAGVRYQVSPSNTCGELTRWGAVVWGSALRAGKSQIRFPIVFFSIFNRHDPSGRIMTLD